jgi:hypothetical protein
MDPRRMRRAFPSGAMRSRAHREQARAGADTVFTRFVYRVRLAPRAPAARGGSRTAAGHGATAADRVRPAAPDLLFAFSCLLSSSLRTSFRESMETPS